MSTPGLSPLPVRPRFPVYGLARSFRGERWLYGWDGLLGADFTQPENRLWHIDLGHGVPGPDGPVLITITDAKLPAAQLDEGAWVGPTGITDAALAALLGAISLGRPKDVTGKRPPEFTAETRVARELSERLDGPAWITAIATVGAISVQFRVRRVGRAWAAAAELDEVAIGVCGCGIELTEHALEKVGDLSDYLILGATDS